MTNKRLLTNNEIAELVGRIEGTHLTTLAERIGLDIVLSMQDAKTASIVRAEERERIVKQLEKEYPAITCWPCWQALKQGRIPEE